MCSDTLHAHRTRGFRVMVRAGSKRTATFPHRDGHEALNLMKQLTQEGQLVLAEAKTPDGFRFMTVSELSNNVGFLGHLTA